MHKNAIKIVWGGQNGGALDKNCGAFCKKNCWRFLALFGKIMALLNLKQLTTLNNKAGRCKGPLRRANGENRKIPMSFLL